MKKMILAAALAAAFTAVPAMAQDATWSSTSTWSSTGNGQQTPTWSSVNGTPVNQNGQFLQNGQVYQPVQTQNINVRTSGCQQSGGWAIGCMVVQGLVQIAVNDRAANSQANAAIKVARATTFQPAGYQQQPVPIGQCVGLNGQQITVFQGQDPNQICR